MKRTTYPVCVLILCVHFAYTRTVPLSWYTKNFCQRSSRLRRDVPSPYTHEESGRNSPEGPAPGKDRCMYLPPDAEEGRLSDTVDVTPTDTDRGHLCLGPLCSVGNDLVQSRSCTESGLDESHVYCLSPSLRTDTEDPGGSPLPHRETQRCRERGRTCPPSLGWTRLLRTLAECLLLLVPRLDALRPVLTPDTLISVFFGVFAGSEVN